MIHILCPYSHEWDGWGEDPENSVYSYDTDGQYDFVYCAYCGTLIYSERDEQ